MTAGPGENGHGDISSTPSVRRKLYGEAVSKCVGAEGRTSFQTQS